MSDLLPPPPREVAAVLELALREDLGLVGDLTTSAVIGPAHTSTGHVVAREGGTIAGLELGAGVFDHVTGDVEVTFHAPDGDQVPAGTELATVSGSSRAILTGERTWLNLLGLLSGIATSTREVVDALAV